MVRSLIIFVAIASMFGQAITLKIDKPSRNDERCEKARGNPELCSRIKTFGPCNTCKKSGGETLCAWILTESRCEAVSITEKLKREAEEARARAKAIEKRKKKATAERVAKLRAQNEKAAQEREEKEAAA